MTIYDIAKKLNVSPATVSLALNGDPRVAEKTRTRICSFAAEHGFVRDEQARNFRLRRSNNVAIVVHNIDNDFWYGIVRAVEQELGDRFNVILSNTEGDLEKERKIFANLVRRKVDGIIVQPASTEENHFLETIRAGIPVVSLEKTEHELISFVKGNDHLAALRLTEESIGGGTGTSRFSTSVPTASVWRSASPASSKQSADTACGISAKSCRQTTFRPKRSQNSSAVMKTISPCISAPTTALPVSFFRNWNVRTFPFRNGFRSAAGTTAVFWNT